MELKEEVKSQFNHCHRLAKKYYEAGDVGRAQVEYQKCARLLEHLVGLSSGKLKTEYTEKAAKFQEIAAGLAQGKIKIYTDGVLPPTQPKQRVQQEEAAQRAQDLVMTVKPSIRFSDIAGLDSVKENIKEAIVYPFKFPDDYHYFGVKPGGGILLYGPPGCGKTMMAAAAAGECEAAFISLKGSDIKNKYVGESEKNIREVFAVARAQERAIIFFDEIDSLAGERSGSSSGHEISLVAELLAQMDGLEAKDSARQYLVLAATNRPWAVDVALRRPGRFDKTVFVPQPDLPGRRKLLELNLQNKPLSKDIDIDELAYRTEGYASSELALICEEAARIPLRERTREQKPRRPVDMNDFEKAIKAQRTVLTSWYAQAIADLPKIGETGMFKELIEAAKEYGNRT